MMDYARDEGSMYMPYSQLWLGFACHTLRRSYGEGTFCADLGHMRRHYGGYLPISFRGFFSELLARAAVRAELEGVVERARAGPTQMVAACGPFRRRCVGLLRQGLEASGGHQEAAVVAVEGGLLGRPSPDGHEEELQHVIVADGIGRMAASETSPDIPLQDFRHLLPNPAKKEEKHGSSLALLLQKTTKYILK